MTAITKAVDDELQSLRSTAQSGHLPGYLGIFIDRTVDGVYAAPGNFRSAQEMHDHLKTLRYLIDLYVYKP